MREEARVGQRTTLDVLSPQQELLTARVNLITARATASCSPTRWCAPSGGCRRNLLNLNVAQYSAKQHFDQVKDLWYGVRTPDGR